MPAHDRQGQLPGGTRRKGEGPGATPRAVIPAGGRQAGAGMLGLQRSAGNAAVNGLVRRLADGPAPPAVQRQLTPGFYTVNAKAFVRGDTKTKRARIAVLRRGAPVSVVDNGGRKSTIKIRSVGKVENSWSRVLGGGQGWIRDTRLDQATLRGALEAAFPSKPTPEQLRAIIAWATPEQRKEAADDDAFLARAKKALADDTYLQLIPALGVHRMPTGVVSGRTGPGAKGHLTGAEADKAIRAELLGEIANAVKAGRQVDGEVSVVGDDDYQAAFNRQWVEAAKQKQYVGRNAWDICDAFVDVNLPKRHIWVHRNFGDFGTVVHEGMHKYADSRLRDEQIQMCDLKGIGHGGVSKLDEGLTEYFTKPVVVNQLKVPRGNYYQGEHTVVLKLAAKVGRDKLVKAYFDGEFDALKKAIGIQWAEFSENFERGSWAWLLKNGFM